MTDLYPIQGWQAPFADFPSARRLLDPLSNFLSNLLKTIIYKASGYVIDFFYVLLPSSHLNITFKKSVKNILHGKLKLHEGGSHI